MTPTDLFFLHQQKAKDVAIKLCWYYACSGALNFQDEAQSEAQMGLWKYCQEYDPSKQRNEVKKERARTDEIIQCLVFGYPPPIYPPRDPYATFWMFGILRVQGGVLDFFRKERLITKPSPGPDVKGFPKSSLKDIKKRLSAGEPEEEIAARYSISVKSVRGLKPTMLYQERFVSLDRPLSDFSNGGGYAAGDTFGDVLPAPDTSEHRIEREHILYMVGMLKGNARLTDAEQKAISLYYDEEENSKAQVARLMHVPFTTASELIESGLQKMRRYAELIVDKNRVSVQNEACIAS